MKKEIYFFVILDAQSESEKEIFIFFQYVRSTRKASQSIKQTKKIQTTKRRRRTRAALVYLHFLQFFSTDFEKKHRHNTNLAWKATCPVHNFQFAQKEIKEKKKFQVSFRCSYNENGEKNIKSTFNMVWIGKIYIPTSVCVYHLGAKIHTNPYRWCVCGRKIFVKCVCVSYLLMIRFFLFFFIFLSLCPSSIHHQRSKLRVF